MSLDSTRVFDIADCVFTVPEGAAHLRVSRSYFYELISAGKIKTTKLGKRTLVQGAELRRFMKEVAGEAR
jgi:excisionase family DNA binding protein